MSKFFSHRNLPLALAIVLFLLADTVVAVNSTNFWIAGVWGILSAQITLLAVWSAWGPTPLLDRMLVGLSGTLLISFTFVAYRSRSIGRPDVGDYIIIALIKWVLIQVPLWYLRLKYGCKLNLPLNEINRLRTTQFGIGQLIALTAATGIVLGLGRLLLPANGISLYSNFVLIQKVVYSLQLFFDCLLGWLAVWSTLRFKSWSTCLLVLCLCFATLMFAEKIIIRAIIYPPATFIARIKDALTISRSTYHSWVNAGIHAGAVGVTILSMRYSGFRLECSSTSAQEKVDVT